MRLSETPVQFHPVIDEAEAELFGDRFLQLLEFGIDKLDNPAGLDVDQMIVMRLGRGLVARAAVAEIVTIEDSRLLEQPHRPVHRRDRDARIDRRRPRVDLLDVGVILRVGQDARDHPALFGDAQALLVAQGFEVDLACHWVSRCPHVSARGVGAKRNRLATLICLRLIASWR